MCIVKKYLLRTEIEYSFGFCRREIGIMKDTYNILNNCPTANIFYIPRDLEISFSVIRSSSFTVYECSKIIATFLYPK